MDGGFTKFPTTPHLLWLGSVAAREDKVLSRTEAEEFLRVPVTIEEKVDGANLGVSFDDQGNLIAQNRGNVLEQGMKGQFAPLWQWLSDRESTLFDVLGDRLTIFGEWCYARHSIRYTMLPAFFLAFDVYDREEQRFMNSARRDEIVAELELSTVPKIATGIFRLNEIPRLLGESSLYDGPMEGVYLRREGVSWLTQRAKVVRAEFVQQIGEHWSKQLLVINKLKSAGIKKGQG
jgi:hypothetical protein